MTVNTNSLRYYLVGIENDEGYWNMGVVAESKDRAIAGVRSYNEKRQLSADVYMIDSFPIDLTVNS